MSSRGSIGLVCLLIVSLLLVVCQSTYTLLAADYRYIKTYIRQKQVVYAVSSGLQALERATSGLAIDVSVSVDERLLPNDTLSVSMSSYNSSGVKWLVCKGTSEDIELSMVQGVFSVPSSESNLYEHTLVSNIFRIDPTTVLEGSTQDYTAMDKGDFVEFDVANYARYAFATPSSDGWSAGLGRSVFVEPLSGSMRLPNNRTVRGTAVFVSYGDITVGAGSTYPDRLQLLANGNIIIGSNVRLDNVLIVAGNSVQVSQGSRVSGKILARKGIVVEKNTLIRDLPKEKLTIATDKYLW